LAVIAVRMDQRNLPGPWHTGVPYCSLAAPARPNVSLISNNNSVSIGKYRVSALSKRLDDGAYSASVSIRSGHGSASTDRVMRFIPQFESESAAQSYAHAQGLIWVHQTSQPVCAIPQ